jgi:GTP-binding protein
LQGNKAIVVDEPGVTRDRLYGRSYWGDHEFMVVDTGGVITVSKSQSSVMEELDISTTIGMDGISLASREAAVARMPSMIEKQAIAAVEESPVIIFLVDGQVIFFLHIKSHVFPSLPCLYLLSLDSYFNIMNI